MPVSDNNLSDAQSRLIADQVREELARRWISRKGLAGLAKISISTLEKALSGSRPLTLATTIRLEEVLGVNLRAKLTRTVVHGLAPGELGYYSRPAVSAIEGTYLTLRPSFGDRDAIYAYRIEKYPGTTSAPVWCFVNPSAWTQRSPKAVRSRCPTNPATSILSPTATANTVC